MGNGLSYSTNDFFANYFLDGCKNATLALTLLCTNIRAQFILIQAQEKHFFDKVKTQIVLDNITCKNTSMNKTMGISQRIYCLAFSFYYNLHLYTSKIVFDCEQSYVSQPEKFKAFYML